MDFETKVDIWKNEGAEPDAERKEKGFEGGYYPSAGIFNWFYRLITKGIKELQTKLSGHADNKNNPHGVTAEQAGAANKILSNISSPTTATKNLLYRGNITASNANSADTYTSIGVYKVYLDGVSGSDFNFPTPYGIFVVNASMDGTSYDYVSQMFYAMGNSGIYSRSSSDKGATWTDWQQAASNEDLTTHTSNKKNPHSVTCEQLGAVPAANSLAKETDLDTVVKSGFYRINESSVNAPADIAYGQLLVVRGGNDTVAQLAFPYNQSRMFFRTGNPPSAGGTGAWKDWTQVYTSFNKPTPADIGAAQIKIGSYVGTGTFGSENKNTITLPENFNIRLVIINAISGGATGIFALNGAGKYLATYSDGTGSHSVVKNIPHLISKNVMTWNHPENADYQLNIQGSAYYYTVVGC